MTTPVTICNLALAHVGASQQVSSIDPPDGSALAGLCARFYPIARREMLEHPWRFARERSTLALLSLAPTEWLYAYQLPVRCIAPKRVVAPSSTLFLLADFFWRAGQFAHPIPPGTPGHGAPFEVEGQVVYTNQPDAVLLHTTDITDTTVYTPAFVAALGLHLGGYLGGVLLKGREGAKLRQQLQDEARGRADQAFARDANAGQDGDDYFSPALRARL